MADPDYFTLEEFRELPDMGDSTKFTDGAILSAAAYFTAIVERECEQPFVPREVTVVLDGSGGAALPLGASASSLTSVVVDGLTVDVAGLTFGGGYLRYATGASWPAGFSNVTITYTAGQYAECPADVKDAVMWATRDRVLSQSDHAGIDVRRTSVTTDFGTTSYVLPGEKRPTGFPELDAVIAGRKRSGMSFTGTLSLAGP